MTFLAGNQGGATPASAGSVQGNATDAVWHNAGIVVAASGTVTAAYLNMNNWTSGATGIKVIVHDSGGTQLGISSVFTSAQGTGLISQSLTLSRDLVASETIYIVAVPTGGYMEIERHTDIASVTVARDDFGSYPYASPPASLPAPYGTASVNNWVIWLDGTTSAVTRRGMLSKGVG